MKCPHCKKQLIVPDHDHAEDLFDDDNYFHVPHDVAGVKFGDQPTVPATGGSWGDEYDPNNESIRCVIRFNGDLVAGGVGGIYRRAGTAWSQVYTNADYTIRTLCVHNNRLFAGVQDTSSTKTWRILVSDDGDTWTQIYSSTESLVAYVNCLLSFNGVLFAGLYQYGIESSTDGASWGSTGLSNKTINCIKDFGGSLYAADATDDIIRKWDGVSTWASVYAPAEEPFALHAFGGYLYCGAAAGKVYRSATGAAGTWSEAADVGSGQPRGTQHTFMEYNAQIVGCWDGKAYYSANGTTWAEFYDPAETYIYSLLADTDGKIYAACGYSSGTSGIIHDYTDATYDPAPMIHAYGGIEVYDQLRIGGNAGEVGSIPSSGGAATPEWIAPGVAGTWLRGKGAATKPEFEAIPASEVTFAGDSYIDADNVQDAIDEVQADCITRAKVTIKTDTGDPVSGGEGEICINTFDNTVKIYAEAGWRSLATW